MHKISHGEPIENAVDLCTAAFTKMLTDASHGDKLLNCPNLTGCKMPETVLACKDSAFHSHITAGYI